MYEESSFLTFIPAEWEEFVYPAARDTGLGVFTVHEDGQVAIWTTEVDLGSFWTEFRRLRDG